MFPVEMLRFFVLWFVRVHSGDEHAKHTQCETGGDFLAKTHYIGRFFEQKAVFRAYIFSKIPKKVCQGVFSEMASINDLFFAPSLLSVLRLRTVPCLPFLGCARPFAPLILRVSLKLFFFQSTHDQRMI